MATQDEFTLVVFGLQKDNGIVRADVFARKMVLLVRALRAADKFANRGKRFDFLMSDLAKSSALATIRERPSSRKRFDSSSVQTLGSAFSAVYEGRGISAFPQQLLTCIEELADGAEKQFSHAEIRYSNDNVIRVDGFFVKQAQNAIDHKVEEAAHRDAEGLFSGVSIVSFDGQLEVIDGRGSLTRGKLILSAGGAEIDCVVRHDLIDAALKNFKNRVRVSGTGIYDGTNYLPQRLNIEIIDEIDQSGSLLTWRGKFKSLRQNPALAWSDE